MKTMSPTGHNFRKGPPQIIYLKKASISSSVLPRVSGTRIATNITEMRHTPENNQNEPAEILRQEDGSETIPLKRKHMH
jgi:hypothetical protein